jgi:hypothetical protein
MALPIQTYIAGIMTGNSLDAVDIATFRAESDGQSINSFKQISFHFVDGGEGAQLLTSKVGINVVFLKTTD